MVPVRLGSRYYIVSPGSLSSSKANSARWPHSIRPQCIVKRVSPAARAWALVFDGNCGMRGISYQTISRVCLPAPFLSDRPTIHSTAGRDRHVGGNHD
jgi:hypothetical protein